MKNRLTKIILIVLGIIIMAILAYFNKMTSEASLRNIELVQSNFSKYPRLKTEFDRLNSDGIITNADLVELLAIVKEEKKKKSEPK